MTRWLAVLATAAAAALQACVPVVIGAGGAAAYSSLEDRRTTGIQIDDESIEVRASNRINDRFGARVHVNVTSYNRIVLLTGEVPDDEARIEAEKIVRAVPNVREVTNDLQIAGISSYASRTNDTYLTTKVRGRLLDTKRVSSVHLKVVTEAGAVYLMGLVTEPEAEEAVDIARNTGGVRKVVKVFEYCKATDELCRSRSKGQ
ncbi:MAG: BON domain-containing protein [Betaproteobacteria bacterium]|jgi:osmotically-inducible protein OsmY|nr:BON domain-containing protein [Betaproteobacteria bacterium]